MAAEKPTPDRESLEKSEKVHNESEPATEEDFYDFGGASALPPPPQLSPEEERKLYRKIDWRIMPIVTAMYLFSFLDRGEYWYLVSDNEIGYNVDGGSMRFVNREHW